MSTTRKGGKETQPDWICSKVNYLISSFLLHAICKFPWDLDKGEEVGLLSFNYWIPSLKKQKVKKVNQLSFARCLLLFKSRVQGFLAGGEGGGGGGEGEYDDSDEKVEAND